MKNRNLKLLLTAVTLVLLQIGCSQKNRFNPESQSSEQELSQQQNLDADQAAGLLAATGTFTSIYNSTIRTSNCASCHSPSGSATQISGTEIDFSSQTSAYNSLTGNKTVKGVSRVSACGDVALVVPGQPYNSYLAGVLIPEYNADNFAGVAGCSPYANHLSDMNLSSQEQASLVAWIQSGARNN